MPWGVFHRRLRGIAQERLVLVRPSRMRDMLVGKERVRPAFR